MFPVTEKTESKIIAAFGRQFVQGNVPEINKVRCMGCSHCVVLCKKLGPDVLDLKNGLAVVARPENCISDGACMMACPTKAMFMLSRPGGPTMPPF